MAVSGRLTNRSIGLVAAATNEVIPDVHWDFSPDILAKTIGGMYL